MTAYASSNATAPLAPSASHGQAANMQWQYCTIALTAALTTSDTMAFFTLPANARIHVGTLKCTDIDTNGSPTVTINVGDAGSATRYYSASTVGQAGTVDVALQATGRMFKTTAKTAIVGSVGTGAATGAAGTLELAIGYVVEDATTSP